ncbi:MAG: Multidrug export protein EmrA [Chlamydiae bacterium]|nr:Multidrug export protein EmrA [Chlamydiota bacterium]
MNEEFQAHEGEESAASVKHKKSKLPVLIVLVVLILLGASAFGYWIVWGQYKVTTSDAYVDGNILEVFPRAQGTIQTVTVNDTDYVTEGQILVILDPTDLQIEFDQSQAYLAATLRNVQQMFDQVGELEAALEKQAVYLEQAQQHFRHRQALVEIGGVSRENFEDAQSSLLAAEAEVVNIEESLKRAQSQTYNTTVLTHPLVINAIEKVKLSWANLNNAQVKAPCSGFIAKKVAQVGESASTSHPVMSIVPLDNLWVTANLKESQLSRVRIGQEVSIKTDLYKHQMLFRGKILGIYPGTGSVFSILPPQNATGNWIKIVQRVPVRIGLRASEIESYPLRVGLSTKVVIDIQDQSGSVLTQMRSTRPIHQTDIYENQLCGVGNVIDQIILENINLSDGK